MFQVRYSKDAVKALTKMPREIAASITDKLLEISAAPHARRSDFKKLKGSDLHRLRVGEWRVVCRIDNAVLTILVIKIATRGDVYK